MAEEIIDPQPDNIKPLTFDEQVLPIEQFATENGGINLKSAFLQSPNYIAGESGWKMDKNGDCEFGNGIFRGTLQAPDGYLGHITLCPVCHGYITSGKTSYTDDTAGFWLGEDTGLNRFFVGDATNYLKWSGSSLLLKSASAQISVGTTGYILGGQTDYNTGTGFFLGYSGSAYKFSIGNPAGNYMTWDGTVLSFSGAVSSPNISVSVVGTTLRTSNDAVASTNALAYTKVKEILFNDSSGTITVDFDMQISGGGGAVTANVKIYKNGVAFGTEQQNNTSSYATKTQNLAFATGDLIQIYAYTDNASYTADVKNFRLKYDKQPSAITNTVNL